MAVRRDWIDRLGGWDERLGAGAPRFGAAEDMDFNYRLLRGGGSAFVTPTVRSFHMQWRPPCELPALYRRYMVGWCAFAIKTARDGDVAGGLWLWSHGLRDTSRMLASAVRRRSRLRARVGAAKLRGLGEGTAEALSAPW